MEKKKERKWTLRFSLEAAEVNNQPHTWGGGKRKQLRQKPPKAALV